MDPTHQDQLMMRLRILQTVSCVVTAAVIQSLEKVEQHSHPYRGADWTRELMTGHSQSLYDVTRMNLSTMEALLDWLQTHTSLQSSKKGIQIEEKLIIFLIITG